MSLLNTLFYPTFIKILKEKFKYIYIKLLHIKTVSANISYWSKLLIKKIRNIKILLRNKRKLAKYRNDLWMSPYRAQNPVFLLHAYSRPQQELNNVYKCKAKSINKSKNYSFWNEILKRYHIFIQNRNRNLPFLLYLNSWR